MFAVPKWIRSPWASYVLGCVVAAVAGLLEWIVHPWVGNHASFVFFLPALVLAVISLGRGPGVIVFLAGAINAALLSPPVGSFAVENPHDIATMYVYAGLGILLLVYGSHLRFTTRRAITAEKRLALAQENTGVGVFELDFAAGTAFVSPGLCQVLGQPLMQGELNLERWLSALGTGNVEDARRAMQERVGRGELRYEREQRVELPDGEIRWLLNRVQLEATPGGIVTQARGATVDITARKRVDEMLRETQASLTQQLQDLSRLHEFSHDLVTAGGDVQAALQSLLDIMIDLYGTHHGIVSLCDPFDKSLSVVAQSGFEQDAFDKAALSLGVRAHASGRVFPVHKALDDVDYESILLAHRALTVQEGLGGVHSMPLLSSGGEVMGAISVMFAQPHEQSERERRLCEVCATTAAAVVEREHARTAAARNEKRFSVALESSLVPFNILTPVRDDAGRIVDFEWTYLNPAAARALGMQVRDLLGRRIGELLPRAWDATGLFDRYVGVVERGEACQFDVQSTATGRGLWFSIVASPLQGSVALWFADITERKSHEQTLQDADRRKDEFLATLAHELRNPLAPIRQSVRIARAATSTEAQRRWSHAIIERQVQHMSLLLDELLDVSRIGRGTLLLRRSRESLSVLIDTAVETARPHIEAKRHHLDVQLPRMPVLLEIDPTRIAQVIGNLLNNAAKYTDPGGTIALIVELDADQVVIRVRDSGIGLTAEQRGHVFEMFSQVPAAIEKSQGGLGIGLALSQGLVQLHGGSIEAVSEGPGKGSEFTVRLPGSCLVAAGEGPVGKPAAPARIRFNRRILIADDNVDAADSLAELLRLEGHEVHVAYDGAQALETFAQVAPDAALLDVGMPQLSGLEVVRAIRGQPTGQRATLIAVTGWGQERDRHIALQAGFDHHLTKPMRLEDIQDLLQGGDSRPGELTSPS